jgi:prepilin-type N-terminal cleavage/methylation domain-containing protein
LPVATRLRCHKGGPGRARLRARQESGFTLVEVMISLTIMSILIGTLLGTLDVATHGQQRQEALVTDQESVREALLEMDRDLRGANPIEPLSGASAYASGVEAAVIEPSGTQYVLWQLSGTTLTRSVLSSPGGSTVSSETVLINVTNGTTGTSLFRYFNSAGTELTSANNTAGDFANCTVRILITVAAASAPGPVPFAESSDVEIRNRLPGGIGC